MLKSWCIHFHCRLSDQKEFDFLFWKFVFGSMEKPIYSQVNYMPKQLAFRDIGIFIVNIKISSSKHI
jgi:hypothetical protein